jgi:hypothetical protein
VFTKHNFNIFPRFLRECFISGFKKEIHAQVLMAHPTIWLEASQRPQESQKVVDAQIKKI